MRLLTLVLFVSLSGLLVGCGSNEDESASENGAELQAGANDPANKPETKPEVTPQPEGDPPVVVDRILDAFNDTAQVHVKSE